jgi:hypothetical protein
VKLAVQRSTVWDRAQSVGLSPAVPPRYKVGSMLSRKSRLRRLGLITVGVAVLGAAVTLVFREALAPTVITVVCLLVLLAFTYFHKTSDD